MAVPKRCNSLNYTLKYRKVFTGWGRKRGASVGFLLSQTWRAAARASTHVSMTARGLAFGLLVCSTLALYEEPPGGCAGPPDDDLLQPPKAIRRPPRPPPPEAPPPAEPDGDDSQAALQRQVCVCRPETPLRPMPTPAARARVGGARSRSPSRPCPRPNPMAPALAPALAEALPGRMDCRRRSIHSS